MPPDEIDEVRIISGWLSAHPDTPQLSLRPAPDAAELREFVREASAGERKLDDDSADLVGADSHL